MSSLGHFRRASSTVLDINAQRALFLRWTHDTTPDHDAGGDWADW